MTLNDWLTFIILGYFLFENSSNAFDKCPTFILGDHCKVKAIWCEFFFFILDWDLVDYIQSSMLFFPLYNTAISRPSCGDSIWSSIFCTATEKCISGVYVHYPGTAHYISLAWDEMLNFYWSALLTVSQMSISLKYWQKQWQNGKL